MSLMAELGAETVLQSQPTDEVVRAALHRLLASPQFANSPRASRFVQYVVETALAGASRTLKEYVLGVEVFDRAASFDPRTDTIVRVEATKLRSRLRDYYSGPGRSDAVIIDVPKGAYAPAFRLRTNPNPAQPEPAENSDSIAVLPFTALSDARDDEYFSDGLAEEIINALSQVAGLKVIARTSAFAFKGKQADIREIAATLRVATILEGSVRRAGDRIRISVQLISAKDGYQLWSQSYDREITDIFAVQEEISRAIVSVLEVRLSSHAAGPLVQRTTSLEAYQAYLEGRYHFQQLTSSHMARGRECHERAIRLDPGYALPHAGMAEYYYYLAFYLNARPRDVLPLGMAAAEKALELDSECAEAYTFRGVLRAVYHYDWNAAGEDFARAIELRPNLAMARWWRVAWFLRPLRRMEESIAEGRRARELDPLNVVIRAGEPYELQLDGKKLEALQCARDLIQLFPEHWLCCFIATFVMITEGFHQEAATNIRSWLATDPENPCGLAMQAFVHGKSGELAAARCILAQLEQTASERYISRAALAIASAGSGRFDDVFRWLEKGVEEHDLMTIIVLLFESDPVYLPLLHKMHLGPGDAHNTGRTAP